VEKYNERKESDVLRSEVLEDFTNEIIDLYQSLKKEKGSYAELGIDFEEKAFYDILKALTVKYDFTYPHDKLVYLAQQVKKVVDFCSISSQSFARWFNAKARLAVPFSAQTQLRLFACSFSRSLILLLAWSKFSPAIS